MFRFASALPIVLITFACGGAKGSDPILTPTLPEPASEPAPDPWKAPAAPVGFSRAVVRALDGIPLYVETFKGMTLFGDERLEAQEVIAEWAKSEGMTVVPPRHTSEVLERAARGEHAATGKTCGAPLHEFQAIARWQTELAARGKIAAYVFCDPDCVIQVSFAIGTGGEGGTEFFSAPFDPSKPWKTELALRLKQLVDNGGHNRHGHANNPVKIAGVPRNTGAKDLIIEADHKHAALDSKETAAATQCLAAESFSEVQVEYGSTGAVARCEPTPDRTAASAACVCRALAGHTGAAGARERFAVSERDPPASLSKDRLRIHADASTAMIPDPSNHGRFKVMTTDPAIEMWDPPDRTRIAPCFTDVTGANTKITARATVDFNSEGKATKATLIATTGTLSNAQQSCLRNAFLRVRVPCPSMASASVTSEIRVSFEAP